MLNSKFMESWINVNTNWCCIRWRLRHEEREGTQKAPCLHRPIRTQPTRKKTKNPRRNRCSHQNSSPHIRGLLASHDAEARRSEAKLGRSIEPKQFACLSVAAGTCGRQRLPDSTVHNHLGMPCNDSCDYKQHILEDMRRNGTHQKSC